MFKVRKGFFKKIKKGIQKTFSRHSHDQSFSILFIIIKKKEKNLTRFSTKKKFLMA